VLDELQGRLESEQKGMKPVYDELRFLHSLCKAPHKSPAQKYLHVVPL
jgi:hypothetical protein